MRTTLRRKMLLYSSSLLIVLIVTMLVFVNYQAGRFVNQRIARELEQGRLRVLMAEEERIQRLRLAAGLVASYPALASALATDTVTLRDFLSYYRQEYDLSDLLLVLDPAGLEAGILKTQGGVYHVAKMPADAGGTLLGYLVAGDLIDDKFARSLREGSNDDIVIAGDTLLGTNLSRSAVPWQTRADWEKAIDRDAAPRIVTIDNQNYEAVATLLGTEGGSRPLVIVGQSLDRAMEPYRQIQVGLLVLGVIVAIAGVATSAVLARNITSPVAKLAEGTEHVAAGNFDYRIDVRENDEIGDLARSFNTMIQGLRERADMRKFVSLSTVEMIQSTSSKKVSAGEKVVLTIFFSDMRGFTKMTENRPPEETVKLLNTCLSLQADKVKRFHGDIDKFVGDCVVALFVGDDMELNAIRCALETHRALAELNASKPGVAPIRVGIGIVTGEVILGSIGSEDRLDYTIIGSNVCSQAGPGQTLIAESTYQRVKGLVAAEKIAPLQVKGFTDPIPVYKTG